jgi:hypothetical protein
MAAPSNGVVFPMPDAKPTTAWTHASLACSILGWLTAVPLPFIDYQAISGATAGVGLIGPCLLGMLSALLAVLALLFGLVALAQTRSGRFDGQGKAWAGIALGGMLFTIYAATAPFLFGLW